MSKDWDDLAEIRQDSHVPDENNLLLIDGNNLAYRWIKSTRYNSFEEEYIKTVNSLAKSYQAKRVICLYDFGKSYYRHSLVEGYKANRKKPEDPEEAKRYDDFFVCLNNLIETLPIENYKFRGIEADDLITFFVSHLSPKFDNTWIVSSDRDLYQLLGENINIFSIFKRTEITEDTLAEEFGVTPDLYLISRIIQGDASDNIKGVEGIGPKRATDLAKTYKSLTKLIASLPIKKKSQYIQNLNASKDLLLLNEKLINLKGYNEEAIKAGKDGYEVYNELRTITDIRS